jgi:hypothetical protein
VKKGRSILLTNKLDVKDRKSLPKVGNEFVWSLWITNKPSNKAIIEYPHTRGVCLLLNIS